MINTTRSQLDFSKPMTRDRFIELLNAAQTVKAFRFCRQVALAWLAVYPGDLMVNLFLARGFANDGKPIQALPVLQKICMADPEFFEAQRIFTNLKETLPPDLLAKTAPSQLMSTIVNTRHPSNWQRHITGSKHALMKGVIDEAEELAHKALIANPDSPLPAIQHIQVAIAKVNPATIANLALLYHQRWPDCLQFSLYLAESYITNGNETSGVALLHQCASKDPAGQVPKRMWGEGFQFKPLWPVDMAITFELPVTASVAAYMGWNQLTAGQARIEVAGFPCDETIVNISQAETISPLPEPVISSRPPETPETVLPQGTKQVAKDETLRQIYQEFERIAKQIKKPGFSRVDGRFPIYVIFSSRRGLEDQYGPQTAGVLVEHMKQLAAEVRSHRGWGAMVFLPDDPTFTSSLNLKPILSNDPWKLKLSLVDLDSVLAKKGSMIGALLIIGGPKIVPFHRLPNPTFDADAEVPSDNPYATLDENYFIPEWPVGRLPGGTDPDAGLLLDQLRRVIAFHADQNEVPSKFPRNLIYKITKTFKTLLAARHRTKTSFGYTAHVWKASSAVVYRPIGRKKSLLTSPPLQSGSLGKKLSPAHLGYFNLHGIKEAAEWYGQKTADSSSKWPEYPIALSPTDFDEKNAPKVIFSEACYGTYIDCKSIDQAMCLNLLSKGSLAIVGSTVVSYGSVTSPLIGADLLGYFFWNFLRQGQSVGNAFLRAKFSLAREMSKRQGFLDGEDQKTLLSFVLYGDPLVTIEGAKSTPKSVFRSSIHPAIKTFSDRHEEVFVPETVPAEALVQMMHIVDQYLPELKEADMGISQQLCNCTHINHQCAECKITSKTVKHQSNRIVVTLSKQVRDSNRVHPHFARFTIDDHGKLMKLSASR